MGIGGRKPSKCFMLSLVCFFRGGAGHNNDNDIYSNGLNGGGIIVIAADNVIEEKLLTSVVDLLELPIMVQLTEDVGLSKLSC